MKLFTPEGGDLVSIERLDVRGATLVVKGEIFGAMPMEAVLTPREASRVFRLLRPKVLLFLLIMPFLRSGQSLG